MNPRRRTYRNSEPESGIENDAEEQRELDVSLATQDWDALTSGEVAPASAAENADFRYEEHASQQPLGEDDDNAYEESDDALLDDEEEAAIARNPSKEGRRFDGT